MAKEYIAHLRERGYSQASLLLYYHAIRGFMEYLGHKFKLKLRKPDRLPRYFSEADIERLIAQAEHGLGGPSHTPAIRRRNANLITVMAFTGFRKSEILDLRVSDVDFERRVLLVRHGKGGRQRVVPMCERVVVPLRQRCRDKRAHERVFDGLTARRVYDIVVKLARACGLDGFHPHSLRHYFATRLVRLGAGLREVQLLLGHRDLNTTAVYLDVSVQHLQHAVRLLDGPAPDLAPETAARPRLAGSNR